MLESTTPPRRRLYRLRFFALAVVATLASFRHLHHSVVHLSAARTGGTLFRPLVQKSIAQGRAVTAMASKKDDKKKGKETATKNAVINLDPPSGTRDFFPDDMRLQSWLFNKFREVAALYGFQEYDAPVLESEELFKRKAGEEITEQMYNFVDKDNARVTLRPEMTPSLARMVLSLMRAETGEMSCILPLKWFSVPQCWRYETTQRGRKREHYQWNMDIVGVSTIHAEAELLSAICAFFERIGITSADVGLRVNSRKVLNAVVKNAGVPDSDFPACCVIIDKLDKIGEDEVCKQLEENVGLTKEVSRRIVSATSAKTLEEFARLAGLPVDNPEVKELQTLFDLAADYGYGDWIQFDASVVRGLAYYTGVVFEGFDKAGQLRAICGGGRYDRLMTLYGSPKEVPCCGFGFGDCVVVELLKEKNVMPILPSTVEYVVAAYNQDMMGKAMNVARRLRLAGKTVDVFPDPAKKVGKAFNYADRCGATRIAFVAPGEWEQGKVRIKDLRSFDKDASDEDKQRDVPIDDLANIDSYFGGKSTLQPGQIQLPACVPPTPSASAMAAAGSAKGAAAGGNTEEAIKKVGDDLRVLKEKLKAEGLSGKKLNEDAGVKALVEQLTALKSGGAAPAAPTAVPKQQQKAASPKAAPAPAPTPAKPAANSPKQKPAAAPAGKLPSAAEAEKKLADFPYLTGFRPAADDREFYNQLRTTSGAPTTKEMLRWYGHMESFTIAERSAW